MIQVLTTMLLSFHLKKLASFFYQKRVMIIAQYLIHIAIVSIYLIHTMWISGFTKYEHYGCVWIELIFAETENTVAK